MSQEEEVLTRVCYTHESETIDAYCKTCKRPICRECFKTEHIGHGVDNIINLYRKLRNERLGILQGLEITINSIKDINRRHLRNVKCSNESLMTVNLANIEKKRTEMHRLVDELTNLLVRSLNDDSAKLSENISKEEEHFLKEDFELRTMFAKFQETSLSGLDLINYFQKLTAKADEIKTIDVSKFCDKYVFETGVIDHEILSKMIGEIKRIPQSSNKVEVVASLQHEKRPVYSISPVSQTEAWVSYMFGRELKLLSQDGRCIRSVKKETKYSSFIHQDSAFLVCCGDQNTILKIDIAGNSSVWMKTSPLRARFIGEALNGNVLISLVDEVSGSRTDQSKRKVQLVTPSGGVLQSYEYGGDGTPVLTRPARLTQNYNSDICVVNQYETTKDEWRGNICVFYEDGGMKFIYSGHEGDFNPAGICCDSLCNIICINYCDCTIHVVSSGGDFLKHLLTRDTYIPLPVTLAL